MSVFASLNGVPLALQSAATTGNGDIVAVPVSVKSNVLVIKGSSGVASGAVQVEAADDPTYASTWQQIGGGPVTVLADTELMVTWTDRYPFVRARVSTVIAGGTVTCSYFGSH
jgi:hypothetical protein